jgi:hypothetical protein
MTTTVTQYNEPPGGGTPDPGEMGAWWDIRAEISSGLGLDLAFCYTDEQLGGLDEGAIMVYSDPGSGWINQGGWVDQENNCVYVEGISALSQWTLATSTPVTENLTFLPLVMK